MNTISLAQVVHNHPDMISPQERKEMTTSNSQQPDDAICRMWNGKPLTTHGAFADIEEYQRLLSMGSNALKGIGAMLIPTTSDDEEAPAAKRLEVSDIFSFFGEVLADNSQAIADAVLRIEQAANGEMS